MMRRMSWSVALAAVVCCFGFLSSASAQQAKSGNATPEGWGGELKERRISLVLPLGSNQVYDVLNAEDFLAGSLKIAISRGGKSNEITVFEKGTLGKDWAFRKTKSQQARGVKVRTALVSSRRVPTARGDTVRLDLVVVKDVHIVGIKDRKANEGQKKGNILAPGAYSVEGTYTSLTGAFDAATWEANLAKQPRMTPEKLKAEVAEMKETLDYAANLQSKSFKTSIPLRDETAP
jgi:hypothetical protein